MNAQTQIDLIDLEIDANRRALLSRVKFMPSTASEYQTAWDRNPHLWAIDRNLFHRRGEAQARRDQENQQAWQSERRRMRAKSRGLA